MSLDSWVFRSSSAFPIDVMILSRDPDDCDTFVQSQQASALMRLPPELLIEIASHLKVNDVVCFTLSCKRAACAIGLNSWRILGRAGSYTKEVRRARWDLLTALERDLSGYHLCHFGEVFRKLGVGPLSHHSLYWKPPTPMCRLTRFHKDPAYKFTIRQYTFCDAQLAMSRHIYGTKSGIPLESLDYHGQWCRNSVGVEHYDVVDFGKEDISPLIVSDEILMHSCERRWAIQRPEDVGSGKYGTRPFEGMTACIHQSSSTYKGFILKSLKSFEELGLSYSASISLAPAMRESPLYRCSSCATKYRITLFYHGKRAGIEVALDAWRNLGQARSLNDPFWNTRHAYSFEDRAAYVNSWHHTTSHWSVLDSEVTIAEAFGSSQTVSAVDEETLAWAWREIRGDSSLAKKRAETAPGFNGVTPALEKRTTWARLKKSLTST